MVKGFESAGEERPIVRWVGEIYEVGQDSFTSILRDDFLEGADERVAVIPLHKIVETERKHVKMGMLFYCDVAFIDEHENISIRSIEFDDELTESMHASSLGVLFKTIAAAEEREL